MLISLTNAREDGTFKNFKATRFILMRNFIARYSLENSEMV